MNKEITNVRVTQNDADLPQISLSKFVFKRLKKIAAFNGIPVQILGESAITRWVLLNWDHEKSQPAAGRDRWN